MRMVDLIQKKRDGGVLSGEELRWMVRGYAAGEIPDYQMSAMLMAIYFQGMEPEETAKLTLEMADVYKRQDVLREDGEAYARKLRAAGVPVTAARFQGIIHDFVMLNSLDETMACRGAMDLSTEWICRRNYETRQKNKRPDSCAL